jgi:hypothetical protein
VLNLNQVCNPQDAKEIIVARKNDGFGVEARVYSLPSAGG